MKRLAILLIVAGALLAPSAALASGVVLKVQRATHLVAVTTGTTTKLVHSTAATRLHVGQRVAMNARTLKNGTLAAASMKVVGRAHKVHFRALLLKKERTRLVVSAGGAVITLHRGRTTSSANDTPQAGSTVDVTATVDNDDEDLDEDDMDVISAAAPGGAIEGTLTIGTGTITIVSEHMALRLTVPTGFDLSQFKNGDEVLAKFTQNADGTLSLTALSGDDNEQEADNDDGDHDGGGDHHGGDHGGGGGGDGGGDGDGGH